MFNTKIPLYGICLLSGLILNIFIVILLAKKYNYPNYIVTSLLIFENIGIIYGAKILAFFQEYDLYNGKFNLFKVGVSAFGGLLGAILMSFLFSRLFKFPIKDLICITMPSVPLIYSLGKMGCFFTGCCQGIEYHGFGNIVYNYASESINGMHLFPVQLVESIVFLIIFICVLYRYKKYGYNLRNIGFIFFSCSLSKFIFYYFRMEHVNSIFSSNQILCISFMLIGIYMLWFYNKKKVSR